MKILDVEAAAEFLGISVKTARPLIARLPHGNVSGNRGPNKKLLIAQETLEKFVLGEIEPAPIGEECETFVIQKPQRKKVKYAPSSDGPIPKRAYR